jgi:hypothetical protein
MYMVGVSLRPCAKGWTPWPYWPLECFGSNGTGAHSNTPTARPNVPSLLARDQRGVETLEHDGDPGLMVIMPGSEMSICSCFGFPSILAMFYSLPLLRLVLFHLSNETKRKVLRLLRKKLWQDKDVLLN